MGGPRTLRLADGLTTPDSKKWNVTCYTGLWAWNVTRMVLLESCVYSACMPYTSAECTVNKLLMMGRGTARKMRSFMPE
jgi:hypothetical protein